MKRLAVALGGMILGACSGLLGLEERTKDLDAGAIEAPEMAEARALDAGAGPDAQAVPKAPHDTWTTSTSMPTARAFLSSAAVGGKGYVAGGAIGNAFSYALEAYDPLRDEWQAGPSLPRVLVGSATVVRDGRIYFFGGSGTEQGVFGRSVADVSVYEPTKGWSSIASMPLPRAVAAAGAAGDNLYVIGGSSEGHYRTDVFIYDPKPGVWKTGKPMPTPRDHVASGAANGAVFVIGGTIDANLSSGTVERYDPPTDTWTTVASMPTRRYDATCAEVNGLLYVIGGLNGAERFVPTVEAYDPATNVWSRKAEMPTARGELSSFVIDGRIFVVGGRNASGTMNTLQIYTP